MSVVDDYLKNNEEYAQTYVGGLPSGRPSRHVAVVACMDSRMTIFPMLGMGDGEAHVIRNAGGVVTDDVIRSLAISQRLLGTREIMLDPPHGLRHAEDDGGQVQGRDRGGDRDQAALGRRGVHRRRQPTCASRSAG